MVYKLLALDLDGTLLNRDHRLTGEIIGVIEKIRMMDVRVLISTGRMYVSALPFIKKLNLSGPMITYNGAFIKDRDTEEVLYHKPLKKEIADLLINEAEENNLHIQMYHNDNLYVNCRNKTIEFYEKISGVDATFLKQLTEVNGAPTKLLIIENNKDKYRYYYNYFRDKYGQEIEVTESLSNYIELGAKGVTKGMALAYLAERFDINKDEIISAGDSWNDYEMIKWAGTGIAMHKAPDKLKEKATFVAPPKDSGGLSHVLKEIFKID